MLIKNWFMLPLFCMDDMLNIMKWLIMIGLLFYMYPNFQYGQNYVIGIIGHSIVLVISLTVIKVTWETVKREWHDPDKDEILMINGLRIPLAAAIKSS